MQNNSEPKPIRDLMPKGFSMIICQAKGDADPSVVSKVVKLEKTTSSYWPFVEQLAMQTDSKAYKARMKYLEAKRQTSKAAA